MSDAELAAVIAATESRCEHLETMLARQLMRVRTVGGSTGAAARAGAQALVAALEQAEYELASARLRRDERARRRAERLLSAVPGKVGGGCTAAASARRDAEGASPAAAE